MGAICVVNSFGLCLSKLDLPLIGEAPDIVLQSCCRCHFCIKFDTMTHLKLSGLRFLFGTHTHAQQVHVSGITGCRVSGITGCSMCFNLQIPVSCNTCTSTCALSPKYPQTHTHTHTNTHTHKTREQDYALGSIDRNMSQRASELRELLSRLG